MTIDVNYGPVSLLTSFSKIFETVMKRRILKHLTKCNILSTEQYGFRVGLRTDNATYKLNNLYLPQANLTIFQKGAYYSGIQIFNSLPLEIKNVAGNKKFKIALKKVSHT